VCVCVCVCVCIHAYICVCYVYLKFHHKILPSLYISEVCKTCISVSFNLSMMVFKNLFTCMILEYKLCYYLNMHKLNDHLLEEAPKLYSLNNMGSFLVLLILLE
jgi:hypothetical protein